MQQPMPRQQSVLLPQQPTEVSILVIFERGTLVVRIIDQPDYAYVGLPEAEQLPQLPIPAEQRAVRGRDVGLRGSLAQVPQDDSVVVQRLLGSSATRESLPASQHLNQCQQDVSFCQFTISHSRCQRIN